MRRRGFVRFTPPQRDSSHATTCDIDPEEAALLAALPSDTEAALDLLRQRASATSALSRGSPLPTSLSSLATARVSVATVAPLVLKSQLGSVLADSAEVESALESMRASNTVRLYRLSASPEVVLCRTSDVRALIDVLSSGKPPHNNDATKVSSSGAADLSFLQKFKRVLEECRGMSVTVQSLRSALEQPLSSSSKHEEDFARSRKRTREVSNASSNGCADDDFSSTILMLERIGFLRARQPGNSSEVTVSIRAGNSIGSLCVFFFHGCSFLCLLASCVHKCNRHAL
jgi:hypothetical protein